MSSRMAQLEARQSPADGSVGADGEDWRRRAIAAEHALADLARVGDLYEDAWAAIESAQSLEVEAREKRRHAAQSLRTALAAHRAAIHMLTAPVDPGTLTE